jgi:hypothetical protein
LKTVFQKLQEAEKSGLSAEHVRNLEEKAAEQGVRVIWKVCTAAIITDWPLTCLLLAIFSGSKARGGRCDQERVR